jgi:hypothetical protein
LDPSLLTAVAEQALRHLGYFHGGPAQLLILPSALAVWIGLIVLGGAVGGRERLAEGDVVFGWAAVSVAVTLPGVFLGARFAPILLALAALALVSAFIPLRRDERIIPPGTLKVVILGLPLLLLAAARMGSEWDEFSQWIPMTLYLFEHDAFPIGDNLATGASFTGYPFGWLVLPHMATKLAGRFVESAGAVFNALLLFSFGLVAVRVWLRGAGLDETGRRSWAMAAFAVLAGTLLSPVFVEKVALTSYADSGSAVAAAIGGVLGWLMLEALAKKERRRASWLGWQFGLAMLVLVNIKQANLVLFVALVAGMALVALRDPAVPFWSFAARLPQMVLPPALIYIAWRYHVTVNLPPISEMGFRPFEQWNLHLMWPILERMLLVASNKGGYFGLMAVATLFGVLGLVRPRGSLERLSVVVATAFLGYNAFLYLSYLGHFGEFDALRAASYWRYNMHLGLLGVVFAAFGLGRLWRRYVAPRAEPRLLAALPVLTVLAAPVVFAENIRFDLEHPKPFYRAVGRQLPDILPPQSRLLIVDPSGTGESSVLTRYELGSRRAELAGYWAAFHPGDAETLRTSIAAARPTHLLVHSVTPPVHAVLDMPLAAGHSYLLARSDVEGWRIVKQWPRSDAH